MRPRDDASGAWRLAGLSCRLLITELEHTPADQGGFAERVIFADAVDIPVS